MNLFEKSSLNGLHCVFSSSLPSLVFCLWEQPWFHSTSTRLRKQRRCVCSLKAENLSLVRITTVNRRFYSNCLFIRSDPPNLNIMHCRKCDQQKKDRGQQAQKRGTIYYRRSCSWATSYIRHLNGSKQLIKKLVHICMIDGKKTRSRAIVYKTFHRLAPHGDVIKLSVNAIENVKPIREVKKVRISGTTRLVPSIIATNRQETLAIRWMLESAKRRMGRGRKISLDQCLYAEILEASQKMGIARKKRDDLHKLAEANRSFSHYRWW
uniref:ribosomal protein S7 n=1 Tax=Pellia neesiana TaxID=70144 RepID=UPI00257DE2A0|nr:ribosomal protein S7 [Pellia neesiana]WIA66945.1 ribosomal protein S7 [Pellia neesiana]WIA66986.1 ribosomal protein S7 [Pellia neesiana]WIA67027.1 ribosomal protein S7 [Pellia neesiana]